MKTKVQHTPLPWKKGMRLEGEHAIRINAKNGWLAATARGAGGSWDVVKANADLIVRAVNAHDELVAALRDALIVFDQPDTPLTPVTRARILKLLAKAEPRP